MSGGLLYLASPYSHQNPIVRHQRYVDVCKAAARYMKAGEVIFCPIAHSCSIEQQFDSMEGFDFWMRQDLPVLARCAKLVVLMLEGWEQSRGVIAEMEFAATHGIPIEFRDP